DVGPSTLANN
nr:RecName: Full=Pregnancy-associated glycoprotein 39C; Short=FdPAG39C [Dama dama]